MRIDIGTALSRTATPGVPRAALERLERRIADAHDHVTAARDEGQFGYAALDPDPDLDAVRETAARFDDPDTLLVVGIGGSALPAAALAAPLIDDADLDVRVLDNADPAAFETAVDGVDLSETVVNVISRSGTTAETVANFHVVREVCADAGVDWTERTLVTTGPEGPLRDLADDHGLATLPAPANVPGRFGIFSPVGLVPLALSDRDPEALLAGAREAADALTGSLFETPAYAHAAAVYALDQRGAGTNVLWPYADELRPFAAWFAQLFAESLGKDGVGPTPVCARGTTDQHAHLQLYRAGPRDKLVTFLAPEQRDGGRAVPPDVSAAPEYLAGTSLGELQDAARRATAASLANADRPSVAVSIPSFDERSMGALAMGATATTILLGELYGVETFDQPAVEWGKRAARGLLGDPDCADEAAAVEEQPSMVVGEEEA